MLYVWLCAVALFIVVVIQAHKIDVLSSRIARYEATQDDQTQHAAEEALWHELKSSAPDAERLSALNHTLMTLHSLREAARHGA